MTFRAIESLAPVSAAAAALSLRFKHEFRCAAHRLAVRDLDPGESRARSSIEQDFYGRDDVPPLGDFKEYSIASEVLTLSKVDWNNDRLYDWLRSTLSYAGVLARTMKCMPDLAPQPYLDRFFLSPVTDRIARKDRGPRNRRVAPSRIRSCRTFASATKSPRKASAELMDVAGSFIADIGRP